MPHESKSLPVSLCPHCGALLDTVTGLLDRPTPRDWFLCVSCAGILRIGPDLRPVIPPHGAYDVLLHTDPLLWWRVRQVRYAILTGRIRGCPEQPIGSA